MQLGNGNHVQQASLQNDTSTVTAVCKLISFGRLCRSAIYHRRTLQTLVNAISAGVVNLGSAGTARPYGLHTDLCLILAGGLLVAVRPHEGEAALFVAEVQFVAVGVPFL